MASKNKHQVDELVNEGKKDKKNINNLGTLVELVSSTTSDLSRFYALNGAFQLLEYYVKKFGMHKRSAKEDESKVNAEKEVSSWLFDMHCDCLKHAGELLMEVEKEDLKQKLVDLYLELLKMSGESFFNDVEFQGGLRQEDIAALVEFASKRKEDESGEENMYYIVESSKKVLSCLDFSHAFLHSILTKITSKRDPEPKTMRYLFGLLKSISENMDANEEKYLLDPQQPTDFALKKRKKKLGVKCIKKKFSSCWLEFLSFNLPSSIVKSVLIMLEDDILPNIQQPRLLYDFLLNVSAKGSGLAVLALGSLFHLVMYHNVQVDDFFKNLYNMLHPKLFQELYMQRFFNLLDKTLQSQHVPESVMASFVKKLARLSLVAPPNGCLLCCKMVINLTKRHHLQYLIHREDNSTVLESDPFDFYSQDPTDTNASKSSLWELQQLTDSHFLPAVRKVADPMQMKGRLNSQFEMKIGKLFDEEEHHLAEKYNCMEFEKDLLNGVGDEASTVDELFC